MTRAGVDIIEQQPRFRASVHRTDQTARRAEPLGDLPFTRPGRMSVVVGCAPLHRARGVTPWHQAATLPVAPTQADKKDEEKHADDDGWQDGAHRDQKRRIPVCPEPERCQHPPLVEWPDEEIMPLDRPAQRHRRQGRPAHARHRQRQDDDGRTLHWATDVGGKSYGISPIPPD
ncbi:hypothetical protein [Acidisphaera sp. S103]|uniref:hypothetical protein n=1 Tax=Acidisphaera sp. S103 TaxID=1747223 RepID=UPI0020B13279|nr:hypothetical protein [Acidisphaera sp. S103]